MNYDRLICKADRAMVEGRWFDAARAWEEALAVPLHEAPNIAPYPRLAIAQYYVGNEADARNALEKAKISLSVLVGIYRCEAEGTDGILDERGSRIRSAAAAEIEQRMCGDLLEPMYGVQSLRSVVKDAGLIALYFKAEQVVGDQG